MRSPAARGRLLRRSRLVLGVLLLACLALFALWRSENPRLAGMRLQAIDWAAPGLEAIAGPSRALSALADDLRDLTALRAENARLRDETARLRVWRDAARRLEAENARLRALNAVQPAPLGAFVSAEVIGDAGGPYARSVIVNVGRDDGVADGAAALDAGGLVGRVAGLAESAARVLLLTDPSSQTPVLVGAEARRAVLAGDERAQPRLIFAAAPDLSPPPALEGARVVTSGEGGVLPRGLLIGHVAPPIAASGRDMGDDPGAEAEARVALAADVARLHFLRIDRQPIDRDAIGAAGLIRRFQPPADEASAPTPGAGSEP